MKLAEPLRCGFPGCTDWGEHDHHITYTPPVIKRLCVRHHEEITIINGQQARKYRRSLSNSHRWWAWYQWIGGKLKARRTGKALEYTGEWGSAPEMTVSEAASPEVSPRQPVRKERKKKQKMASARKMKRRKLRRKPKK